MHAFDITFFIPCLNEEANIINTLDVLIGAVEQSQRTYEILVYDDHSTDNTVGLVEGYARAHPEISLSLIKNTVTKGLGTNYLAAPLIAQGKYLMLICGDSAATKEYILLTLEKLDQADIIIPHFKQFDNRHFIRKAMSQFFTSVVNLLSGYNITYYNGGAIHLTENIAKLHLKASGFGFQAEAITRLLNQGATYVEVSVPVIQRKQPIITKGWTVKNLCSIIKSFFHIGVARLQQGKKIKHQVVQ